MYRYLLGVAGYVAVAALRGEIGASRMETRVVETVLMYAKDTLTGTFEKVKDYMNHGIETKRSEWIRTAKTYRIELGLSWEQLQSIEKKTTKNNNKNLGHTIMEGRNATKTNTKMV